MRILIIEDDSKMSIVLRDALEKQAHRIVLASSGNEGLDIALSHQFEAIILDAMLPGIDGFTVARSLRTSKIPTPVLMLTARDATKDIVHGLDSGVDDYLTKPFTFEELFAPLRALGRRMTPCASLSYRLEDLELDPLTHAASRSGVPISLTRTEFLLLEFMMRNPHAVLRRDRMINAVWGYERTVENNTLDAFMKQLRSKVDGRFENKLIHTVQESDTNLPPATNKDAHHSNARHPLVFRHWWRSFCWYWAWEFCVARSGVFARRLTRSLRQVSMESPHFSGTSLTFMK
jgi:DNA-binding response OmpR family regulator